TVRVEYARELIVSTGLPLKAVAMEAGLGTASFLCRLFRSTYGVTPGSLRKYPDRR
ncbi:MAG: helix-turn-helix domain-containing protein, partial [Planctomycetota bacterium]